MKKKKEVSISVSFRSIIIGAMIGVMVAQYIMIRDLTLETKNSFLRTNAILTAIQNKDKAEINFYLHDLKSGEKAFNVMVPVDKEK